MLNAVLSRVKSSKKHSRSIGALSSKATKVWPLVRKGAMKVKNKNIYAIREKR